MIGGLLFRRDYGGDLASFELRRESSENLIPGTISRCSRSLKGL